MGIFKKIALFFSCFIFIFLVLASGTSAQSGATLLFSDNFEGGSLSGYTAVNAAISTAVAYSGTHSAKITHSGTAMLRKDLDMATMLNHNEITIRYRWYTSSSWILGTGVKFARLRTPGQELQTELWFSENLGTEPLGTGGLQGGNSPNLNISGLDGSAQSYNKGRWMQIQIHYVYNSPGQNNGIMEVSFDGVRKVYNTSVGFRNRSDIAFNQFYLPSNIGTSNSNCINYIDDIEIWSGNSGGTTPPPATCSNCCSSTQTCPTAFTTVGTCTRCCATACQTASTDTTAPRVTAFTIT